MAKKIDWIKGNFPGVRFYKHDTRKHGVKFDKYYSGSFQVNKKRKFIGFGWSSEGWLEDEVWKKINKFKHNLKTGIGPTSLKEEFELREVEEKEIETENMSIDNFYKNIYKPVAKKDKRINTMGPEGSYYKTWIKPELGHLPFHKIKPFNLEKLKKVMIDANRAPRTIQHCFAIFRRIWNFAKLNDIVNEDCPTRKVKLPKVENQRLRFFSHEEANALLNRLQQKSQQVYDMTLLSLHTGMRSGEVRSLIWGVVDFKNKSIAVRDSKGKFRHAYLTEATYEMLNDKYKGQNSSETIFKDRDGQPVKSISKTFDRTVKELNFNEGVMDRRDIASFHTCRHTFASWHVQNGTDLYELKELLGHSTIQLTERYSHLKPDGLKKVAQNFDKMIKDNIIPLEKTENG